MTAVGEIAVKFDYRLWIALTLKSYQNSELPKDDPVHATIAERGRRTEALLQSIEWPVSEIPEELPVGTKPLFTLDPKLAQAVDEMAAVTGKDYAGKSREIDEEDRNTTRFGRQGSF